jgi:large subunit ribosomal protein L15
MPLVRRVPKRGFFNSFAVDVAILNVGVLDKAFKAGEEVTIDTLRKKSLIKGQVDQLKILGHGTLGKKLRVSAHRFSKSAEAQIRKSGGEVIVLAGKTPVHARQSAS